MTYVQPYALPGAPVLLLKITQISRGRSDDSSFPTPRSWYPVEVQAPAGHDGSSLTPSGGSLAVCGLPSS